MAQIVEAHAAADNRDALIAQWRKRLADSDMGRGVEIALQRHHHHRDLGLGIDNQERHENAVIIAALGVLADRQAGRADQALDLGGDRRRAGRRIFQLIGMGRKAVVVVTACPAPRWC